MKISVGSDHAGYQLKKIILNYLTKSGNIVIDRGCFSEERADYPDYGHQVANDVLSKEAIYGIVICGSGNGINMTVNKHAGIRSALCWNNEIATLSRQHNDANIIALPARYISDQEALLCIECFLKTAFEGGRHAERIKKIDV